MKDKFTIQRTWKTDWFDPIAVSGIPSLGVSGDLDIPTQAAVRTEIAKEVGWVVRVPDIHPNITIRLNKMDTLLSVSATGDISNFDPFWPYRKSFFEWTQV